MKTNVPLTSELVVARANALIRRSAKRTREHTIPECAAKFIDAMKRVSRNRLHAVIEAKRGGERERQTDSRRFSVHRNALNSCLIT